MKTHWKRFLIEIVIFGLVLLILIPIGKENVARDKVKVRKYFIAIKAAKNDTVWQASGRYIGIDGNKPIIDLNRDGLEDLTVSESNTDITLGDSVTVQIDESAGLFDIRNATATKIAKK